MMWLLIIAVMCAGLFAGAAMYVNAVEHPARVACGTELAIREFGPSYRRATVLQVSLAMTGCAAGLLSAWQLADTAIAWGAACLVASVPFTLVAIVPINARLLDPALDPKSANAEQLLTRWGRLHAVRTVLSTVALALLVSRLALL